MSLRIEKHPSRNTEYARLCILQRYMTDFKMHQSAHSGLCNYHKSSVTHYPDAPVHTQ